jgi:prepilin-type processing-associated H-X9-DG protein
MKQIIQATLAYAADNNGYLPQPNDKAFTYTPGWLYTPPLTAPVNPLQLDAQAETGSLWNYLRTHSVYHCPDDIDPPYPDPQYAHYLTSYIFNDVLLGFPRDNTVHPAFAYPWRRLSPLGVLFWDGGEQLSNNPWNDATSYPDEGIGTRHAGGANIGFFSGSVEWMSAAQIQQELTKTPGRFWCNPATSSGQ